MGIIASWLGRIVQRGLEKAKVDLTLTRFAGKAVRWAILILVLLGCLSRFGIEMTSFAALIAAMGLTEYFSLVVAGNTTARIKPDPMPLHYAADHFSIPYAQCLMVGDSSNDVKAARAAGFNIICVTYGYNHGNDISDSNPDLVVGNLNELNEMFA